MTKLMIATWGCKVKDNYQLIEWYPILKILCHNESTPNEKNVYLFSSRNHHYMLGDRILNWNFLRKVKKIQPDYIIMQFKDNEFYDSTLKKVKQISPKTILVGFFGDIAERYDLDLHYSSFMDYNLTTELDFDKYTKMGFNNLYFLSGSSAMLFYPTETPKIYDVTFVGADTRGRYKYIKYLYDHNVNIKLFGKGWGKYPEFKSIYGGYLSQADYIKTIHQTKINLSLSEGYRLGNKQIKGRIFEMFASKCFCLSEYVQHNLPILNQNSKVTFRDEQELLEKIKFFLANYEKTNEYVEKFYDEFTNKYSWEKQFFNFFKMVEERRLK